MPSRLFGYRPYTSIAGINHQYQSQPHSYLTPTNDRLLTRSDQPDGIDRETDPRLPSDQNPQRSGRIIRTLIPRRLPQYYNNSPFLIGKDALEGEALWDKLYRPQPTFERRSLYDGAPAPLTMSFGISGQANWRAGLSVVGRSHAEGGACLWKLSGYSVETGKAGAKAKHYMARDFFIRNGFWHIVPGWNAG